MTLTAKQKGNTMTRAPFKDDIRIVIYPRSEGDYGWISIGNVGTPETNARHLETEAGRIMSEIRRHVDAPGQVSIAYNRRLRCSYCGDVEPLQEQDRWPECCSAEQSEFFAAHSGKADAWFFDRGLDDADYLAEFRAVAVP